MFGSRYRFQSVGRVLDDLERYATSTRHVFFCDDNFAARRGRAKEICRGILDRGLKIEWSAQVRTDCAQDPELLDLMAKAGCWCVYLGLESTNPRTLEAYDKRQSVDDIRRSIAAFRGRSIRVHGMFVFGCDTDDRRTLRDTVRFARQTEIDTVQFLILTPAPGTPVYDDLTRAGRIRTRDWSLYDAHHVVFEPVRFTPDELQHETERASARFYSLGGALRSLKRGDLFGSGLRLYAWHETRRNRQGKRPFLRALRQEVFRGAQAVRELLPKERVHAVALPTVGLSEEQKRFLVAYVRRLGLRPVELTVPAARFREHAAALRERAGVVLLPIWEEAQKQLDGFQRLGSVWAAKFEGQAVLALPWSSEDFYRACVETGLALDRRLGRVRRALRLALAEASTV
jgi:hypothetical protein